MDIVLTRRTWRTYIYLAITANGNIRITANLFRHSISPAAAEQLAKQLIAYASQARQQQYEFTTKGGIHGKS